MAKAKLKNASVAETSPLSPACYFACKKYYEIGEHNNPDPLWLVVREIDMAQPGNPHAFVFHRPDYRWPYSERAPVIQSLRDGIYRRGKPVNQYYRPLDVKLSAPTCFVFCLSDRWNWRFSSKVRAASLAEDDSQTRKYSKLRHYLHDNDGQYEPFESHENYCKIISFDAIPDVYPVIPGTTEFSHGFNLVIEVVNPDGDPPKHENLIPIIIDPDVRYPGGSGV